MMQETSSPTPTPIVLPAAVETPRKLSETGGDNFRAPFQPGRDFSGHQASAAARGVAVHLAQAEFAAVDAQRVEVIKLACPEEFLLPLQYDTAGAGPRELDEINVFLRVQDSPAFRLVFELGRFLAAVIIPTDKMRTVRFYHSQMESLYFRYL